MSTGTNTTLAAIVALLADAGHDVAYDAFRARDVAPPRASDGCPVSARTVARHMRRAGYATPSLWAGVLVLTPAGLAAVEAARAARAGGA